MKTLAPSLALYLVAFTAACGGTKIDPVASISIRDSEFVVVRVVQETSEINALLASFRRAKKVGVSDERQAFPYKIDIDGRWLYAAGSGEFMYLSKTRQPVYRLSDRDRTFVNSLLVKTEPIQPPAPPVEVLR